MTNFNCVCPAIQRGQGSGFLSEGSYCLTAWVSEQRRFWPDCADAQAHLNLRYSHRRYVSNSLDAAHFIFFDELKLNGVSFLPNCIHQLDFCIKSINMILRLFEPHDKTNKMSVHPAKTQVSLGISPVWSESLLSTVRMKKPCILSYPLSTQRRLWSDWVGAQADLSLCWAQSFLLVLSCGRSFILFSLDMGKETLMIYIRTNIKKLFYCQTRKQFIFLNGF